MSAAVRVLCYRAGMGEDPPDRRRFLKVVTCALGGGVGIAAGVPVLALLADPSGKQTVTAASDPFDLGPLTQFAIGAPPTKIEIVAPVVKDAWSAARNVVLGAAWVQRTSPTTVAALSAVCPHLGCAVGWDAKQANYLCPCHDSRFAADGAKTTGPSERGLDPLPVRIIGERLELTWVRYKLGQTTREPA